MATDLFLLVNGDRERDENCICSYRFESSSLMSHIVFYKLAVTQSSLAGLQY